MTLIVERKQVIVVRKDLNMRKGKMVAQGAHASLAAVLNKGQQSPDRTDDDQSFFIIEMDHDMEAWVTGSFKKICVSVNSEAALLDVYQQALDAGLHCSLIKDSGLTEFAGVPTYTTCAVGPGISETIDQITGKLPLL